MSKKIEYYSTDKLYNVKKKSKKGYILPICVLLTLVLLVATAILFKSSITFKNDENDVKYTETGNVDYKVYLRDNEFYDSSFLNSGMQYVANLIKTINVKFNYELHANENLKYINNHKVNCKLQITEVDDPTRVLYTKDYEIIPSREITKNDNNLIINEEIDIDYNKYNNIVNEYKRKLGLIVSSSLTLTFDTSTNIGYKDTSSNKGNKLQIVIPLSESTLKIGINGDEINNSAYLMPSKNFNINNQLLFAIATIFTLITIALIVADIYLYIEYREDDPYKAKLNSILRNYDRLIVTGNISIDESKYSNVIVVGTFNELVDAASNLEVPIMHYEVIEGEKSIFIVTKGETLVKYRVTKAYLNNKNNEVENINAI